MLAHIHFQRKDGTWSVILRKNFNVLVSWIKRGDIVALNADTLTVEEAERLYKEGIHLIPDEKIIGNQIIKILRVEG